MPELPEVELTMRKLAPLLCGRRVTGFWTDWPRGLANAKPATVAADIVGRCIVRLRRTGKVLFVDLSRMPARILAVHLRMSGRLEVVRAAALQAAKGATAAPARWVHFRWQLSDGRELRFVDPRKFGVVWYGAPAKLARDPYLGTLGADAAAISRAEFREKLRTRRAMVKPLLLRQDIVAGIGNILADEALWRAGVHPRAAAASLSPITVSRLHRGLRQTIAASLGAGGTSIRTWRHPDGSRGRYQEEHVVYGRAGAPCRRCRSRLQRIVVASRGTTYCPRCQRVPR